MQYRTSKCPYCGSMLESMTPTGLDDFTDQFGDPIITCSNCGGKIRTGRQFWDVMLPFDKFMSVVRAVFNTIFVALFALLTIGMILVNVVPREIIENPFVWGSLVTVSFMVTALYNIYLFKKMKNLRPK
jgi:DNA-directed RNA polymerase subunit RPC12/RpoP